ncbi:MAG TPA: hypothetical protein VEQ40_00210 [Pyrinomonadaceae bacterium]|nr:hypothetical protein [Pyrinomonadaceae bacterium]
MSTKKAQQKAGAPPKPRGQEMGRGDDSDQNRQAMADTPALRGRRKGANKMFADESSQHVGNDAATPRSNTPSLPAAMPTGVPLGESGGERAFKQRQSKQRKKK